MFPKQEIANLLTWEQDDPAAILEIKEDIREECEKLGEVTNVVLFDKEPSGVASVRFANAEAAQACVRVRDALQNQVLSTNTTLSSWMEGGLMKDSSRPTFLLEKKSLRRQTRRRSVYMTVRRMKRVVGLINSARGLRKKSDEFLFDPEPSPLRGLLKTVIVYKTPLDRLADCLNPTLAVYP